MKNKLIIGLLIFGGILSFIFHYALLIGFIIILKSDYSKYETLESPNEKTKKDFEVVGYLDKQKEMYYDPQKDPNYFTFWMKDTDGVECKVVLYSKMPQDFKKSNQIVVTGKMNGDEFEAKNILIK